MALEDKLMESNKQILGKAGYPWGAEAMLGLTPWQTHDHFKTTHRVWLATSLLLTFHRHQVSFLSHRSQRSTMRRGGKLLLAQPHTRLLPAEALRRNPADPAPRLPVRRPWGPLFSVHTTLSTELAMGALHLRTQRLHGLVKLICVALSSGKRSL